MASSGAQPPRPPVPTSVLISPIPPAASESTQSTATRPKRQAVPDRLVDDTVRHLRGTGVQAGRDAAGRLEHVRREISSYSSAQVYSTLDPLGVQLSIEQERGRAVHFFAAVRNILILLPLSLTWFGLFWATQEYQRDLKAYPDDVNHPFLELWQNGFHATGGLNALLSFSHLALVDVMLFLALVGVGIVTDLSAQRARDDARQAREKLEACASALGLAAGQPAPLGLPTDDIDAWEKQVRELIGDASGFVQDVASRMNDMTTHTEGFQRGAESISVSAERIGLQAGALTAAVGNIDMAMQRMAGSADLLGQHATSMQDAQRESTAAVRQLIDEVRLVATHTQASTDEVTRSVREFSRRLDATRQATDEAVMSLSQLAAILAPLAQSVGDQFGRKAHWWQRRRRTPTHPQVSIQLPPQTPFSSHPFPSTPASGASSVATPPAGPPDVEMMRPSGPPLGR